MKLTTTTNAEKKSDLIYQYGNQTANRENTAQTTNGNLNSASVIPSLTGNPSNPSSQTIQSILGTTINGVTTSNILLNGFQYENPTQPGTKLLTTQQDATNPNNQGQGIIPGLWNDKQNKLNIALGNQTRDEDRTNCTTTDTTGTNPTNQSQAKNRKLGICSDGTYQVKTVAIDSVGNYIKDQSGNVVWTTKTLERDTVTPAPANLSVTKAGSQFHETLAVNISNSEAGTEAHIYATNNLGETRPQIVTLDSNGNYNTNNFWGGILKCGGVTYTVNVKLIDRAGNISSSVTQSITSGECPVCTTSGTGQLMYPINNPFSKESSPYGTHVESRGGEAHAGQDFAGNYNDEILAADSGTVKTKGYEDGGWGNYIILRHDILANSTYNQSNTPYILLTIYAHLSSQSSLTAGQSVTKGQVIGSMGNSGDTRPRPTANNPTAGTHLHFQVEDSRYSVDYDFTNPPRYHQYAPRLPADYLGSIQGNVTTTNDINEYCINNGVGQNNGSETNLPPISGTDATTSIATYIKNNLADETEVILWNTNQDNGLKDLTGQKYTLKQLQQPNLSQGPNGTMIQTYNNPINPLGFNRNDTNGIANFFKNNIQSLKSTGTENPTAIYALRLGKIYKYGDVTNGVPNQSGHGGAIIPNNYQVIQANQNNNLTNTNTSYIVKNGLYSKYQDQITNNEGVLGVPTNEEQKGATKENNNGAGTSTKTQATQAYWQGFERGYRGIKYNNNRLFWTNTPTQDNQGIAKFLVNKVADKYNTTGDVQTYGYPRNDTISNDLYNKPYCKQAVENDPNGNGGWIDLCIDLISESTVRYKDNNKDNCTSTSQGWCDTSYTLQFIQTPDSDYTPGGNSSPSVLNSKFRYQYNPDNKDNNNQPTNDKANGRNVWIVSHGMNNGFTDISNVSQAIYNHKDSNNNYDRRNDIILSLDWRPCATALTPNGTDQCIRPIAQNIADKLKQWGLSRGSKLNMVGHSMGTLMITEIAKAINDRHQIGDTNSLTYLDPPSQRLGGEFSVIDKIGVTDEIYNSTTGYNKVNARVMRAYTGLKKNGDENWCGDVKLNRTAKESISLYIPDVDDTWAPGVPGGPNCALHGAVHKVWSKLISEQQIPLLNDNQEPNPDETFYKDDTSFDTSIQVSGTDTIDALLRSYQGNIQMIGRENNSNIFKDFDKELPNAKNKKKIMITNFNDPGDRISLEKSDNSDYEIVGNTIRRNAKNGTFNSSTGWYDAIVVEGDRVSGTLPSTIQTKLTEGMNSPNGNDWFIPR